MVKKYQLHEWGYFEPIFNTLKVLLCRRREDANSEKEKQILELAVKKKEELTTWQMDTILLVFSIAFLPAGICFLLLIYCLAKYFCSLLLKPYEESSDGDSISLQCKKKCEKSYSVDETVI